MCGASAWSVPSNQQMDRFDWNTCSFLPHGLQQLVLPAALTGTVPSCHMGLQQLFPPAALTGTVLSCHIASDGGVTSALCTMDDTSCFLVIRLGQGSEVSNCATTLHGFCKHASSRREAVSVSRGVPRYTEKKLRKIYASSAVSIVRLVQFTITIASDSSCHSFPSYHLPGGLVSTSSVPIPSIDLSM